VQVKKAKPGKEAKAQLGVAESKLGAVIQEETGIPCVCNELVGEVLRGVRLHATRFLKGLEQDADLRRSQLGLAGASHGRLRRRQAAWPAAARVLGRHAVTAAHVCHKFPRTFSTLQHRAA